MKHTFLYIGMLAVMLLTTGCRQATVYYHYEHMDVDGWDRVDTIHFYIPPVDDSGTYEASIGLRITDDYPFQDLTIVVNQTRLPARDTKSETHVLQLADDLGNTRGQGVSEYQYLSPLEALQLQKGDSLHVCIYHDMRREILKGVTDVGFRLKRIK